MTTNKPTLLVTGASGHLGRRVVELLLESEAAQGRALIATSRTPDKLDDLARRGVEVRPADFDDRASLERAFRGAGRVLLVSTDALDRPGRRIQQHQAAVNAALATGVRHVAYTSLTNPGPDSLVTLAPDHFETEQALSATSLGYTILRNNLYTDYLLHHLPHEARSGRIVNAFGQGAVSYVTREDCARAAAAALAAPFDGRVVFDITGPEAITQAGLAAIASEISGTKVEYEPIDAAASRARLAGAGLPEPIARLLVSFESSGAAGQLGVVSSHVRELTGRAPTSVRELLTASRASWAP